MFSETRANGIVETSPQCKMPFPQPAVGVLTKPNIPGVPGSRKHCSPQAVPNALAEQALFLQQKSADRQIAEAHLDASSQCTGTQQDVTSTKLGIRTFQSEQQINRTWLLHVKRQLMTYMCTSPDYTTCYCLAATKPNTSQHDRATTCNKKTDNAVQF